MKSKVSNETIKLKKRDMNDHYIIFLAFDLSNNELLLYPYSICGCYDSRQVCSHFGGFLLLIQCIQKCEDNQELFEQSFPANPISLQNSITLIEYVGFSEKYKISKRKKVEE